MSNITFEKAWHIFTGITKTDKAYVYKDLARNRWLAAGLPIAETQEDKLNFVIEHLEYLARKSYTPDNGLTRSIETLKDLQCSKMTNTTKE
jgi:hypothetical protein